MNEYIFNAAHDEATRRPHKLVAFFENVKQQQQQLGTVNSCILSASVASRQSNLLATFDKTQNGNCLGRPLSQSPGMGVISEKRDLSTSNKMHSDLRLRK